jgi:3-dehydroquinate synthase II
MTRDRVTIAPIPEGDAALAAILERARRRGFRRFVQSGSAPIDARENEVVIRRDKNRLVGIDALHPSVAVTLVATEADLEAALRTAPDEGILLVEWAGDRLIPLENAVASRGHRFQLWAFARSPEEVPGALGALEHGADHVVVEVRTPEEVDRVETLLEGPLTTSLDWRAVPLETVTPAGIGDRVLVDTTSLLRPEEGLLVGSAAAFLFHVRSEAVGSKFSRPRPFRVNAGSAHSYVLMADGSTRYLSELEGGDSVLAAVPGGTARAVRVGRIKIERRPMVLLRADEGGSSRTVFLQEAETVRLSTDRGPSATTEIRPGAQVYGARLPPARHLGREVEETLEER